jgi:16S rRNA G966 N2-methylase RsmD
MEVQLRISDARKFFKVSNIRDIRFTERSICEATSAEQAYKITKMIAKEVANAYQGPERRTMLDLSAGIGCNAISFAISFATTAVELDQPAFSILTSNIDVIGSPVIAIQANCIEYIEQLGDDNHFDCVFIDAPWSQAKNNADRHEYKGKNITLAYWYSGMEIRISQVVRMLANKTDTIVIKVPNNMDHDAFHDEVAGQFQYMHTVYINEPHVNIKDTIKHRVNVKVKPLTNTIYQLIVLSNVIPKIQRIITANRIGYKYMPLKYV